MVFAGIAAALAAAVANAFAVVLQAAEARRAPADEAMRAALLVRLAHRRSWLLGTGLLVVAGALQVLALGLAPITLVQPTLSTSLLVLLVIARRRLPDRIGSPEVAGALAIVFGLIVVVLAGPHHTSQTVSSGRLIAPLATVGGAALLAFAAGRVHTGAALSLAAGAALAYAWSDFAAKLLAGRVSSGAWGMAAVWLCALIGFGALAFLEENSALQRRPPAAVSPIIDAIKVPLPVVMALWAGIEHWQPSAPRIAALIAGLAGVAAGAAALGRSAGLSDVGSNAASSVPITSS
jgi:drug/metabolite transporter (DMT)-like permease